MRTAFEGEGTSNELLPDRPRTVAVVGNASDLGDQGACIDRADWILRFNNAPGFGRGAGGRVTHLALVNHGGQMREWLADPHFVDRPAVQAARLFLFPFPRKLGRVDEQGADGRDWTDEATARLTPLRTPISILPDAVHRTASHILKTPARPVPIPSTGFLVALHLLERLPPGVGIGVHGFGFAGWDGHSWGGERRWFEAMAETGRLRLHPLGERLE